MAWMIKHYACDSKNKGLDARRLSRFTQLALLGAIPLKPYIGEKQEFI